MKIRIYLLAFLSLVYLQLSGCVLNEITIVSPAEGVYFDQDSADIKVNFTGDASKIVIMLNGINIKNQLTISGGNLTSPNGNVQGMITGLGVGLNVLKITLGTNTVSRQFAYYDGIHDSVTPLMTEAAYNQRVQAQYNSNAHDDILALAKQMGYTTKIAIPYEVNVDVNTTLLSGRLYDDSVPDDKIVSVMSIKLNVPGYGSKAYSHLIIQTGKCYSEIIDRYGNSYVKTCLQNLDSSLYQTQSMSPVQQAIVAAQCTPPCAAEIANLSAAALNNLLGCTNYVGCTSTLVNYLDAFAKLGECMANTINTIGDGGPRCGGNGGEPDDPDDGASGADPHIITPDNLFYDSQLVGEFVLVREKSGSGFEVQTRQGRSGQFSGCTTFNIATAIRLNGDIIEYSAYGNTDGALLVNGSPVSLNYGDEIALTGGGMLSRNVIGIYALDTAGNRVRLFRYSVTIEYAASMANNVEGLQGNYNGNREDDTMLRSGVVTEDRLAFNEDWRITNQESLFTYKTGESTATFTDVQSCKLIPSQLDLQRADEIYLEKCGIAATANEQFLVDAIALDLAAGLVNVDEWLDNICLDGTIKRNVQTFPEGNTSTNIGFDFNSFQFAGNVTATDLLLRRVDGDLIIMVLNSDEVFEVKSYFYQAQFDDLTIDFSNNTYLDASDIRLLVLQGTDGDDLLEGFNNSDDVLDGGAGNDVLIGNGGNDTYVFGRGYGSDVVRNYFNFVDDVDRVKFTDDVKPGDIQLRRYAYDLIITILDTGETLTLSSHFFTSSNEVESLDFSGGTRLTKSDIDALVL